MQNFREAVKRALKNPAEDEESKTQWEDVLNEFAASINEEEKSVLAFVRRGAAPTVRHLVLAPKGCRDQNNILLSVAVAPDVVVVLSGDRREFTSVEDFQTFLVRFAALPTFRESLDTLRNMAGEPVVGFLRFGHPRNRSPSLDIVVKIPTEEQHRLADAAEASQRASIEINVEPIGPSPLGQGVYDPESPPRWLVAGGYVLAIKDHNAEFGRIKLRGTPEAPLDAE